MTMTRRRPGFFLRFAVGGTLGVVVLVVAELLRAAYRRDLPWFDGADPSGTIGGPELPPYRVVVLGDSTVTGPGVRDPADTWVGIVARELAISHRVALTSFAVGGATSVDVLRHQAPSAAALRPDLVLLSVGGDDVIRRIPPRVSERNVGRTLDVLAGGGARIVVLGLPDLGTIPRLAWPADRVLTWASRRSAAAVRRAVSSREGVLVDIWDRSTVLAVHPQFFAPDAFHPAEKAHRLLASSVLRALEDAGILERGSDGGPA